MTTRTGISRGKSKRVKKSARADFRDDYKTRSEHRAGRRTRGLRFKGGLPMRHTIEAFTP